ncbi:universal stress protein [Streptomyces sp. CA-251247]|uniref:universal stress protein n=1 Tax=Streptomyces sp. CA-251247 TaxID=3240062 RepID=UPI003D8FF1F2
MAAADGPDDRIVVGVDGSPPSYAALRWAMGQARLTDSLVEALIGWDYPVAGGWPALQLADHLENAFGRTLAAAVERVAADVPGAPIRQTVVDQYAARALLAAAQGAQLLVVGNRGHGGFTEALLGSVSQHCVHLSPCPVVVVRGTSSVPDPDRE